MAEWVSIYLREELSINGFMFDTNIFNHILEGKIILKPTKDIAQYFVTHIQQDELNACKGVKKRKGLLNIFEAINPMLIPTESGLWDVSAWGLSKWDEHVIDRILELLEKEKPRHRGNERDALIGLTAIKTGITLVSDDGALQKSVNELGGTAISLRDFLKETDSKS